MTFKLIVLAHIAIAALLFSQVPTVLAAALDNNDNCESWAEKGECDAVRCNTISIHSESQSCLISSLSVLLRNAHPIFFNAHDSILYFKNETKNCHIYTLKLQPLFLKEPDLHV